MPAIRIWAVESDYDQDAMGKLARKVVDYLGRTDITIQTAGQKAYNSVAKRLRKNPKALHVAVESYLKKADILIFVLDSDSQASLAARRKQRYSMINQIEKVVASKRFAGRVYLAMAIQEVEAWLLVDCVGVACYFLKGRYSKDNCRDRIVRNRDFNSVIRKYQKGNTELIVESERGGRGAKEYLVEFSKALLRKSNPRMKAKSVDRNQYREALAPEIFEYIEISRDTLRRNPSLKRFCQLLEKV